MTKEISIKACVQIAALLVSLGFAGDAQAVSFRAGWVWASSPTAAIGTPYTVTGDYSYNSGGGAIAITRLNKGVYAVDFAGLGNRAHSNVQVTAYDSSGYCMAGAWFDELNGPPSDERVEVHCYDANGDHANSYFNVLFQYRSGTFGGSGTGIAFVLAQEPGTASYTPNPNFSYNSTGGTNTIKRRGPGSYTVFLPGFTQAGGDVQVTANQNFINGPAARCKVVGWNANATVGTAVDVHCFDKAGTPHDAYFSLAYANGYPFGYISSASTEGAYAWADAPTDSSVYTPDTTYNFSTLGSQMTAQKTAAGAYTVNIPTINSYETSTVLITGYGPDSTYCNVVDWFPIELQCYKQGGVPIDSKFDVTYQTSQ